MKYQRVRGTQDLLPSDSQKFRIIESTAFELARCYGYGQIQTPIFESSDVFHRSMGETSDVVHKETYTFVDRGGDSVTLRPEGTAGVVRAFVSEGLAQNLPLKFYYYGPMFRYERPQKGRYRQFHQIGIECLGYDSPQADVESLSLAWDFLSKLQLSQDCHLEINTLGDKASRENYRQALVQYLSEYKSQLSADSQMRLEKNPLRILDSKDPADKKILEGAPSLQDHMTSESLKFYHDVLDGLKKLKIPFKENPKLVRGLDYYTHTVFEFVTTKLGAQGTVLAGGRYDGLVETLGGAATPGVGWAAGVERLCELYLEGAPVRTLPEIAILPADEAGESAAPALAQKIRQAGIPVDILWNGNIGKKMKKANTLLMKKVILLGSQEVSTQKLAIKDLATGEQVLVNQDEVISRLK